MLTPLTWLLLGAAWLALAWLLRRREAGNPQRVRFSCDVLAGGALLGLTIGFFWRTISGDVFQPADGGDLVSFLFPTYRFAAAQLNQWTLPLWNPHLYGGAPFVSDIQAGFLYPPNLSLFLINPEFAYPTMQWLAIGHIYWAGLGLYVMLRVLCPGGVALSRPAALFGAIAFQFSDPLLLHLGNLNLIAVLSWLPWVLATFHLALQQRRLSWAVVAGVLFAVANYAGHAPSTVYIGLALGVYGLLWALTNGTGEGARRRVFGSTFGAFLVTFGLATLLSAPILLPALELTQYTERSEFVYQDTVAFSLAPAQTIGLITPGFFGRGPALHWSLWDRVELPYAGVATLLLAIGGLLLVTRNVRRALWPWLGLALFGFLTALGIYAILHGWLTLVVPGFDQFRAPARALVLWTLGLAVLAAAGFDGVAAWRVRPPDAAYARYSRVLKWGGLLLAGIFVPLMYLALLLTQDDPTAFLRASLAALAITLAAGFWLTTWTLVALRRAEMVGASLFAVLMIGLLFFDLSATGAYTDIAPENPARTFDHPELVGFLQADPERFRIDTRTDIADLWQPDAAALHGLEDVWGVANPLMLQQWDDLWESTGGRATRLYDTLNVKYVLVRDGTPLPEGKFALAFDAPGELALYENMDFWPRAWLVHEATFVPPGTFDATMLRDLNAAAGIDLTTTAVVELPADQTPALEPAIGPESVTEVHYGSSRQSWDVTATAPGLLVLSETWYPGWRATVNDTQQPVLRVNGAQRAIPVPAGSSSVALQFLPQPWRWGLLLFVVGIAAAGIIVVFDRRQRRR
jgi:hypothetical protein